MPYYRKKSIKGRTQLPHIEFRLYWEYRISTFELDMIKTRRATPVNFIHSVESFILFRIVLKCYEQGISCLTLHDCIFASPKDIDSVHRICLDVLHEHFVKEDKFLYNILEKSLRREEFSSFCKKLDLFRRPLPSVPRDVFKREY